MGIHSDVADCCAPPLGDLGYEEVILLRERHGGDLKTNGGGDTFEGGCG